MRQPHACTHATTPILGFLGPQGTYSYQAAIQFQSAKNFELKAFPTIASLFAKDNVDFIVAPFENSTAGCVTQTLEALYHMLVVRSAETFKVVDQIDLSINHCFMKNSKTENIKRIYSHPEALAQCKIWIQETHPSSSLISVSSTAHAALLASTDLTSASISNRVCADLYGLTVVSDAIAPSTNTTRFILLQRAQQTAERVEGVGYKTMILFAPSTSAAVTDGLRICAGLVDIERILSKPVPVHLNPGVPLWSLFYVYIVKGHEQDEAIVELLQKLENSYLIGTTQ